MTTRMVAMGMLVALRAVVAAFMAIALIGPRDVRLSADTGSALIARELDMGRWTLQAQLALAGTGAYELGLRFVDEGGAPTSTPGSPTVRVSSVDHDMGITSLRSEEHTSELQSLMRISYAVFCLKKKKNKNNKTPSTPIRQQ